MANAYDSVYLYASAMTSTVNAKDANGVLWGCPLTCPTAVTDKLLAADFIGITGRFAMSEGTERIGFRRNMIQVTNVRVLKNWDANDIRSNTRRRRFYVES